MTLSNITHTWSLCTQASLARHQGLAIHAGRCIATTLGSPCDTSTTLSVVVTHVMNPTFPSLRVLTIAVSFLYEFGIPALEACTTSMSSSALYIYASESFIIMVMG